MRTELVEQIDGQLNELLDDVLHDVDHLEPTTDPSKNHTRLVQSTYFSVYWSKVNNNPRHVDIQSPKEVNLFGITINLFET